MKKVIAVAALAALAVYVGSPYWTTHRLQRAAAARDADVLSSYIDFPAVRESLKSQLAVRLAQEMQKSAGNPLAAIGQALGAGVVGAMVDYFVTPEGIAAIVTSGKAEEPRAGDDGRTIHVSVSTKPEARPKVTTEYAALDTFRITLAPADGSGGDVVLTLARHGFSDWKVSRIQLPLPE